MAIEFNYTGDYNKLTNERIKGLVVSAGTQTIQNRILKILLFGFGATILLAVVAGGLGFLFGFFGTVLLTLKACMDVNKNVELNTLTLDDFWKKESFLFASTFIECTKDIDNKRTSDYCLRFLDENGNVVQDNILKEQYAHFLDFKEGDLIIVLKYPNSHKTGYEYKGFDPALFDNRSCIQFIKQGNMEINKKWESHDNGEDW